MKKNKKIKVRAKKSQKYFAKNNHEIKDALVGQDVPASTGMRASNRASAPGSRPHHFMPQICLSNTMQGMK